MSTTRFTVHTSLETSEVMGLLTDFGPDRATRWPSIDQAHFKVHELGSGWAEVTEGNSMAWERERYTWDLAAGTVDVDTLDSNLWGSGSGWRYRLTPASGGTDVEVTLTRVPKVFRARLLAVLVPVLGGRVLGKQLEAVLRKAETH